MRNPLSPIVGALYVQQESLYGPRRNFKRYRSSEMKLGFCPSIGPLDIETIVDVTVEWELGEPHLVIDAVSILGSETFNLLLSNDRLMQDIGCRIASMAEDDERLLDRAVEQYEFERAA